MNMYANAPSFSVEEGNEIIKTAINCGNATLIARFGETELRTVHCIKDTPYMLNKLRIASYDICNNAGFFPRRLSAINRFSENYIDASSQIDYLASFQWENEEKFTAKYNHNLKGSFPARVLDVAYEDSVWSEALRGKRVLVVSPFSDSILKQYKKKDKIWEKNKNTLLDFELHVVKAVQSIGGNGAEGFASWFEALQYMKNEIEKEDFDVALLGCGAYGLPLASYIKQMDKVAILMGGCLQLMFGIMGKRWEGLQYVMKHLNEYWIRPKDDEVPKGYKGVENGCYW